MLEALAFTVGDPITRHTDKECLKSVSGSGWRRPSPAPRSERILSYGEQAVVILG